MSDSVSAAVAAARLKAAGDWLSRLSEQEQLKLQGNGKTDVDKFLIAYERLVKLHRQADNTNTTRSHNGNGNITATSVWFRQGFDQRQDHDQEAEKIKEKEKKNLKSKVGLEYSYFQYRMNEDVMLRIFDYADPHTLAFLCCCCRRFSTLTKRTIDRCISGTVYSRMKSTGLLQAKYCIDRTGVFSVRPFMPFLFSGLPDPIWVTGSGRTGMNGTYFCHSVTAYGFEFKKMSNRRVDALTSHQYRLREEFENSNDEDHWECHIAKRFDQGNLFWYMFRTNSVGQSRYHYWAPLLLDDGQGQRDALDKKQKYPPTTSDLHRTNQVGWQCLGAASLPAPHVSQPAYI
uniref:F-box domain-containing protein n=1 Tax=Aplanochytrium stocchinoi TaxID=215587 RepID=A0A7S3LLV9_9STRA|mmetsp:Transcript_4139/g.4825  ORF Transcript_4139/g.4825 Transcript_4139/m.4825 type:complete len:345 (+) Transcript_4139:286-1320(+)